MKLWYDFFHAKKKWNLKSFKFLNLFSFFDSLKFLIVLWDSCIEQAFSFKLTNILVKTIKGSFKL